MNLNNLIRLAIARAPQAEQKIHIQEQLMSQVYKEVQKEVEECLLYGPCNSRIADAARLQYSFFSRSLPAYKLRSAASCSKSLLYERIKSENYPAMVDDHRALDSLALQGFWAGTGTCETYATLGAIFLAQKYQVAVSIENIHSDLIHTYLRVHTKPVEYIFDFWTNSMVRYGDWIDWNEAVDYEYRHTPSAHFSFLAEEIQKQTLDDIYFTMYTKDHLDRRKEHLDEVNLLMGLNHANRHSPMSVVDVFEEEKISPK